MSTSVLVALVRSSSFLLIKPCSREEIFLIVFVESWTVFIPKTSDTDDLGRIIRSPDALRPLTLCTCECKRVTSAFLSRPSLVHYAMHSLHTEMHLI